MPSAHGFSAPLGTIASNGVKRALTRRGLKGSIYVLTDPYTDPQTRPYNCLASYRFSLINLIVRAIRYTGIVPPNGFGYWCLCT